MNEKYNEAQEYKRVENAPKIIVAGDVCVDWFMYPSAREDVGPNWRLFDSLYQDAKEGGAWLLAAFLEKALDQIKSGFRVVADRPGSEDLRKMSPDQVLHSNAKLSKFKDPSDTRKEYWRVSDSFGYCGPSKDDIEILKINRAIGQDDILVLDDPGNSFRNRQEAWKPLINARPKLIIYKINRPLMEGQLWRELTENHKENLVIIVHAKDLRKTEGVQISQSLSWERTAKDFFFQLQWSNELQGLRQCPYLIVLFETDGAVVFRGGNENRATLLFDPLHLEGGFAAKLNGDMIGLTSCFTAALTARLAENGFPRDLAGAVKAGLRSSRELLKGGFKLEPGLRLNYPFNNLFASLNTSAGDFATCDIPASNDLNQADPDLWRILDDKTRNTRLLVARNIVKNGENLNFIGNQVLKDVPQGVFGKLKTIDRSEIESFGAIRELITEFLNNPSPERPLCFAVFGPPGSGKSFGVKQVLKSINYKNIEKITFNLSQFHSYQDLVIAFHKIRDIVLDGNVPFVFFDEFDSPLNKEPLGWLKYFLAPMQDAEFKDEGGNHPLGKKAIMVFAGGTRASFEEFEKNQPGMDNKSASQASSAQEEISKKPPSSSEEEFSRNRKQFDARLMASTDPPAEAYQDKNILESDKSDFIGAKGPDFVSRLRGFINIMGPNRQGAEDDAYIIRRAKLIRALMLKNPKLDGLFTLNSNNEKEKLRIDEGVLRAMLHVTKFKHGARSMEALLDMSRLSGKQRFDLSALPPQEQLKMHVDADEFRWLAVKERFYCMLPIVNDPGGKNEPIEWEAALTKKIAALVNQEYETSIGRIIKSSDPYEEFKKLPIDFQNSNISAAEDIPNKLWKINFGVRLKNKDTNKNESLTKLNDELLNKLAEMEHERFCRERRLQGWTYGEKKAEKQSLSLVCYEKLNQSDKEITLKAVEAIPKILDKLGYEIYQMIEEEE